MAACASAGSNASVFSTINKSVWLKANRRFPSSFAILSSAICMVPSKYEVGMPGFSIFQKTLLPLMILAAFSSISFSVSGSFAAYSAIRFLPPQLCSFVAVVFFAFTLVASAMVHTNITNTKSERLAINKMALSAA